MNTIILLVLCVLLAAALGLLFLQNSRLRRMEQAVDQSSTAPAELAAFRAQMETMTSMQTQSIAEQLNILRQQQVEQGMQTELKLDNLRRTLNLSLEQLQQQNQRKLDEIRLTVDEKLQNTLEKKLNDSFTIVSQRLEQVYRGLGEMQTLAVGVGDLKRVLSNVKTRGTLGELQLGAILEQILAPEQYAQNVSTKKGSSAVVEFAIRLPGDGENPLWLPIDSKYPGDAYEQLLDAYDAGDAQQVERARRVLRDRLRSFAKDIHDKYIDPPNTTDFALMFLPVEGLYAEAVRLGMIEQLQGEFKINLVGPTTTAAVLNSLQLGFRTLAVQKRSVEVWKVLGAVKGEFSKFAAVLEGTQRRLTQANEELDKLVGVRTRQIQRTLREVELPQDPKEEMALIEGEDYV